MNRGITIFLLLIFCFNLFGFIPVFRIVQRQIRSELKTRIKESVPENELHAIDFSKHEKDIVWIQPDKEFRLHEKMYDIVRVENVDEKIIYYCVDDVDEARLFAHLDEMVKDYLDHDQSTRGKTAKKLLKSFSKVYLPTKNINLFPEIGVSVNYCPFKQSYYSLLQEVGTPPPESVSFV